MGIGSTIRKAVSAFGGSKKSSTPTGTTGTRTTHSSSSSGKSDIAKGAAKVAKKKL